MTFSVVIPIYNGAATLEASLASLASQSFTDWEAVVVDDGSTDATPELLRTLSARDPRFRIIRQPNGGVSKARNRAFAEAKGDWILGLDADDFLNEGALEQVARLVQEQADCNLLNFPYLERPWGSTEPPTPVVGPAYRRFGGTTCDGREAFRILYGDCETGGINWQPWRFAFRRDSLPCYREGVIHEDVDVTPLFVARQAKVYLAKEPFYIYTPAREGAATAVFSPKRVRDIQDVMRHIERDLAAMGPSLEASAVRHFRGLLAYNLFGYLLAIPSFPEAEREPLLSVFAAHPQWFTAIEAPRKTAWLKRLFVRLLGVRWTANLFSKNS